MKRPRGWRATLGVALAAQGLCASPVLGGSAPPGATEQSFVAPSDTCPTVHEDREFSFFLDEDNFQVTAHTDDNYTLGTGFGWGGLETPGAGAHRLLDAPLDRIEAGGRWLVRRVTRVELRVPSRPARYDRSLLATAFTPRHIERPEIQYGDRPYAFLLGYTVTRSPDVALEGGGQLSFWRSEATIGTIGSPVGEVVQRSIHAAGRTLNGSDRPPDPAGWSHQILDSRYGVPTARYQLMHVWYWRRPLGGASPRGPSLEVVREEGFELGYHTDAQAGASVSLGWSSSRLWTLGTHPENPGLRRVAPVATRYPEAFVYAALDGSAWAYNALLQGYGNWMSDYRLSRSQMESFTYQLQIGVVLGTHSVEAATGHRHDLRLVYVPETYRSREFKGPLATSHHWGAIRIAVGESFDVPIR